MRDSKRRFVVSKYFTQIWWVIFALWTRHIDVVKNVTSSKIRSAHATYRRSKKWFWQYRDYFKILSCGSSLREWQFWSTFDRHAARSTPSQAIDSTLFSIVSEITHTSPLSYFVQHSNPICSAKMTSRISAFAKFLNQEILLLKSCKYDSSDERTSSSEIWLWRFQKRIYKKSRLDRKRSWPSRSDISQRFFIEIQIIQRRSLSTITSLHILLRQYDIYSVLFFKTDVNTDVGNTVLSKIFRDGDEIHDTRNYIDVVTRRVCMIATKIIKWDWSISWDGQSFWNLNSDTIQKLIMYEEVWWT